MNNGVCKILGTGKSKCECQSGYQGRTCEESICDGYCNGNGDCIIRLGSPMCQCNTGFWGKQCQSDSCREFCENGGNCTNDNARMSCECPPQYTGDRCQIPVCLKVGCGNDACDRMQCKNGGTCYILDKVPICNCTKQWHGTFCDVSIFFYSVSSSISKNINFFRHIAVIIIRVQCTVQMEPIVNIKDQMHRNVYALVIGPVRNVIVRPRVLEIVVNVNRIVH